MSRRSIPSSTRSCAKLVTDARRILQDEFVGAYLQGSFSLRDADEHSDVDFVVVTRNTLNDGQLDQLQSMHKRIYETPVPWAQHLEGSYIPAESLRVVDPGAKYVFLDNGATELEWDEHCNTALVRWILREHGIVLGTVATKSKAAEWALHSLDPEWADLIRAAVDDRSDPWKRVHQAADPKAAKETLFADYTERVAAG